ncbi:MAG: Mur ligase family protein, partial [Raoultibacter sp.]
MGLQCAVAQGIGALSTWGLKRVFKRPAGNFPGKVALYVDPHLIADLSHKLRRGSVIVCGTNGKTTTTNLLADALETANMQVICNRSGANLDSGIATALLHGQEADWGVFESDELWLAKVLPQLKSDYLILLNLFRDQLDRVGEIDRIQDSIVGSLKSSPQTVLVYNADDPLCEAIAQRAGNKTIAFGVGEDMGLPQNTVADAQMCQMCSGMLNYEFRQYGQLGRYACSQCGFSRPKLDYAARSVRFGSAGLSFDA